MIYGVLVPGDILFDLEALYSEQEKWGDHSLTGTEVFSPFPSGSLKSWSPFLLSGSESWSNHSPSTSENWSDISPSTNENWRRP
jgi:hypothetical protein